MPRIYVDFNGLKQTGSVCRSVSSGVEGIRSEFRGMVRQLDWDIRFEADINTTADRIAEKLERYAEALKSYQTFIDNVYDQYTRLDSEKFELQSGETASSGELHLVGITVPSIISVLLPGINPGNAQQVIQAVLAWWFKTMFLDEWNLEGALVSGEISGAGEIFGIGVAGGLFGELIGGSIKKKGEAKWEPDKGNIYFDQGIKAEGHLAEGSANGQFGILGGNAKGDIGAVGAEGTIGASLYKDGELSPELVAKLKAEAAVAKGETEAYLGEKDNNVHAGAEGSVLGAEAEAKVEAGAIDGEIGVEAKVGAEAYLAKGELSGGVSVFGIDIDVGVSGTAGGVGASAEGSVTTGGVSGSIGGSFGLGAGLELSIDWSDFVLWDWIS